jgi:predicted phage baseplate assembly protein
MPLADNFPVLDNRRFADIVAEARTRIPRYTPEWTDFNAGDPGFALVELCAWMTELLTYRLGLVPKLNYLKFLELIGIELLPAAPATATIVFPVQPTFAHPSAIVPSGTQVAAAEPDALGPIVFETERTLTALRAQLDAVQAFDGYAYTDVSPANTDGRDGFYPFGPLADSGGALLLGFSDIDLAADSELALAFWPTSNRPVPPPTPCDGVPTPVFAPARIVWEFWSGTDWRGLTLLADNTLALTRSGIVRLKTPPKGQAAASLVGSVRDKARFWLRGRLDRASYEEPPMLLMVRANAVTATQAQSVASEILGGSDGSPGQTFTLSSAPVLAGSLMLDIDEGQGVERWTEVDDFLGSGPDDPVYILDRSSGIVRFGDGQRGRIPVANVDNPRANIVATAYRFGGGMRGNVAAGVVTTLMTSLGGIDAGKVTNPVAADGGTDEEDLDGAITRSQQVLKSRDRAVTAADFEQLAKQAGPVGRAKALPLYHPDFPGMQVPGVVTVIIVPLGGGAAPKPSEGLLRTVCAYLDARRLLTTELYVVAPTYVPVSVSLELILAPNADGAAVQQNAVAAITGFLGPLTGGADKQGWPFGGTIFYSDLFRQALIDGVQRVEQLVVTLDHQQYLPCTDVPLPAGALLEVASVEVSVLDDPTAGVSA